MTYKDNIILQQGVEMGIIDLLTVEAKLEQMNRQKYLAMHPYSMWQGTNGKWYTRLPCENGSKKLVKKSTKESLENAIIEYYKGAPLESNKPTYKQVFQMWLKEKIKFNEITNQTFDRYSTEFERFFKETILYDCPVDLISESMLDNFIRTRIVDLKLTSKAYGNMRTLIMGIFKFAKRNGYTELSISSFFSDLGLSKKVFAKVKKRDEDEVFSNDETERLIQYFKDNPTIIHYGLLLTFQCGLREGELAALRFSDLNGNKLHIHSQEIKYKDVNNKGKMIRKVVDYTKSEAGDRYIFVTDSTIETINKIRELNPNAKEFMMHDGKRHYWSYTFNDRLYKACDAIGIKRRSMHKIRKTYGTRLIDSGAQDSLVKMQMGHSDISTTRKHYYYSTRNDADNLAIIERAISF